MLTTSYTCKFVICVTLLCEDNVDATEGIMKDNLFTVHLLSPGASLMFSVPYTSAVFTMYLITDYVCMDDLLPVF